jgi:hypothetical protein
MVDKELNDNEILIMKKIFSKAGDENDITKPVIKFMNDNLLKIISDDDWKIIDGYFTMSYNHLLDEYKKAKNGLKITDVVNKYKHISFSEINNVNFKMMIDGLVMPFGKLKDRDYILKKYYKPHDEDEIIKKQQKTTDNGITKNDQKKFRSEIISTATTKDISKAGFKDDFINSLGDDQKMYIKSLSDLQIKIMRSEVVKRHGG